MAKIEGEHSESLAHVKNISELERQTCVEFDAVVDSLLKSAPNAAGERQYRTDCDSQPPTDKAIEFKFGNSTVRASFHVDFGSPPTHRLELRAPIIVDDGQWALGNRVPHEIVEFESTPFNFRSLSVVNARAVTNLGDSGYEITIDEYSAGGLLPPINTLGKGKIEAFRSVIALFSRVVPENPVYKESLVASSSSIRP